MKRSELVTLAAILLILLGGYMIYLGTKADILPPTLTGVGFIVIAFVFFGIRK